MIKSRKLKQIPRLKAVNEETWLNFLETMEQIVIEGHYWTDVEYFMDRTNLNEASVASITKYLQEIGILKIIFAGQCPYCASEETMLKISDLKDLPLEISCENCGENDLIENEDIIIELYFNIDFFDIEELQKLRKKKMDYPTMF